MAAGASQKVTIGENLTLDFTGLFSTEAPAEATKTSTEPLLEADKGKGTLTAENGSQLPTEGLEGQ